MQFREIVKPLDRSNRRDDVDEGGGEDQRGVEVYTLDDWQVFRAVYALAASHLGKVFKTGETVERSSREMAKGEGREDFFERMKLLEAKAIGEHRLIICRSKDVMETATPSYIYITSRRVIWHVPSWRDTPQK